MGTCCSKSIKNKTYSTSKQSIPEFQEEKGAYYLKEGSKKNEKPT
jgi:hypothetical protein